MAWGFSTASRRYGEIRREDRPKSRAWPRELDEGLGLFGREKGGIGDLTTRIIGEFCSGDEFKNLSTRFGLLDSRIACSAY
jgi:hypothetical protein